jgi:hypothetical protein
MQLAACDTTARCEIVGELGSGRRERDGWLAPRAHRHRL